MEKAKEDWNVIFPLGEPSDPRFFTGEAWASVLVEEEQKFNCPVWNVTFSPGARNNWHKHPGGQILLITSGEGWYQEWDKPAKKLRAGEVVTIPANVKHWHGAASNRPLTHLAICTNPQKGPAEWLEAVSEEDYLRLNKEE